MKLARARLTPFALPLRTALTTAHGAETARPGVLVELETADGRVGCGEATPPGGFGAETADVCLARGAELCRELLDAGPRPAELHLARLDAAAAGPCTRFALETALLDLCARKRGVPLADVLAGGRATRRSVALNALLSAATPEHAAVEARRALAEGFETLKLKVGSGSPAADCARVSAVRAAVGDEAELRIDANGAWDVDLAISILRELDAEELELAEQPVAAGDVAGLARVRAAVLVPIAADESAADPARASELVERRAVDALVLKPAVLGGLRAALALAVRARAAGVRVWVTSALDGAIGRAAALALAAALPGPLPACGLATGAWLAADLGHGPEPKDGCLDLCEEPGLGAAPDRAALAALATGPAVELVP